MAKSERSAARSDWSLWSAEFTKEGQHIGASGFFDLTQTFYQPTHVRGPDLIQYYLT